MKAEPGGWFRPEGPLSRELPGYEYRQQQEEMADRVAGALATPHNLAVEAGTGVGKSLAYLLPAALWARETGNRVAVSTYTRLLQSQLTSQDIPLLRRVLPDAPRMDVAYGQENYLCRFRLNSRLARGLFDTRSEAKAADRLLDWAGQTDDGVLVDYPHALPARLARRVGRDSAACRRADCPYFRECFYYRARARWEEARVLVVNHFLFFASLGEDSDVLPEIHAVVFDEAHRLEDACVRHFGADVREGHVVALLDTLNPKKGRGLLTVLKPGSSQRVELERETGLCREALTGFLQRADGMLSGDSQRRRLEEPLDAVPTEALARLSRMVREASGDVDDEHLATELKAVGRRLGEYSGALGRFEELDTDSEVHWVERDERAGTSLVCAPLDVSGLLRERVYPNYTATVLTSATLTVAGRFDFLGGRLGLDRFKTLALDSPFDYRRQGLLFVAGALPPPTRPEFVPAAAELIGRILIHSRGRAMVLFTSFAMMDAVRERMPAADYRLLCQGELPVAKLLHEFREDTGSVLFATQSFWQGVDIPGDSLSCLVICRLPFEVPDDPRLSAIAERMRQHGMEPFGAYQLPVAVLRFRQGFGRLIRSTRDRGVVCVLDSRVRTRAYGRTFLDSLPAGLPVTTDLAAAVRVLDGSTDSDCG